MISTGIIEQTSSAYVLLDSNTNEIVDACYHVLSWAFLVPAILALEWSQVFRKARVFIHLFTAVMLAPCGQPVAPDFLWLELVEIEGGKLELVHAIVDTLRD